MLTRDRLKELLSYDSDTGLFTWNYDRGGTAFAGSIAGTLNTKGYVRIKVDNRLFSGHRLAFLYTNGEFPKEQVDHINNIRHDNRWNNLRLVSPEENQHNRKKSKNNKTGIDGVYWEKARNKYKVQIYVNNTCINIGRYATLEEAKKARENAKRTYHPTSPEARALSVL
jgi:hypothetical protein